MPSPTSKPSTAGGRRRGRQPTFDRDEALAVAMELFWRHGYDGVAISDLTSAIGIAAPSLYHAFGSKAELYREALRRYLAQGVGDEEFAAAATAREAVELRLRLGLQWVTQPNRPAGCMVSCGLLTTAAAHAELAADLRQARARLRQSLQSRIQRDVDAGTLQADAEALAGFYASVLAGMSVQAIDGATREQLSQTVELALRAWPD